MADLLRDGCHVDVSRITPTAEELRRLLATVPTLSAQARREHLSAAR